MRRRAAGMVVVLAFLATLLGCSDNEHVVPDTSLPTRSPDPTPTVPTNKSLVRYVSPKGDNHARGTFKHPWRTLRHAFMRIYVGQVLFVRGGRYHENIDQIHLHPGRADAPITVLAYPGENPVLVGSISLNRPNYWLIDDLDVTGDPHAAVQPSFMVKVTGGNAWTWENSEFTDPTGRAGVMITGWGAAEPSRFAFRSNCLHDLPRPPARTANLFLGAMGPAASGTVSHNVVFNDDNQPNVRIGSGAGAPARLKLVANTIYGGSLGIDVRGRPYRLKIARNVVGASPAPAMIRFALGSTRGTTVSNNVAVEAQQLLRPEVSQAVNGTGNLEVSAEPGFVDPSRCDGFRPDLDALIPYGAEAP